MSQSKKIAYSIIILGLGAIAVLSFDPKDMRTSAFNFGNKEYYEDEDGQLWVDRENYDALEENSNYYQAPDGTIWQNEYRYLESQR